MQIEQIVATPAGDVMLEREREKRLRHRSRTMRWCCLGWCFEQWRSVWLLRLALTRRGSSQPGYILTGPRGRPSDSGWSCMDSMARCGPVWTPEHSCPAYQMPWMSTRRWSGLLGPWCLASKRPTQSHSVFGLEDDGGRTRK